MIGTLLELLGDVHWMFVTTGVGASVVCFALFFLGRKPLSTHDGDLPPVSVIKPFDGTDPDLAENFWSYVVAPYPAPREILFCTARDNAEGIAVVRGVEQRLAEEPRVGVSVRLLLPTEGEEPWITRKVWHMARGLAAAEHDVVINGDSGTRVGNQTLEVLVRTLLGAERRGAVWAPYLVEGVDTLGARLTRLAWTSTFMNFLVLEGMRRLTGQKSMLAGGLFAARKVALLELDGLKSCDGYLTEDLEVGYRMQTNGWEVGPSPEPVVRHMRGAAFSEFFARQLRWNTIIWRFGDPLVLPYPLVMTGLALAPWTFVAASMAFPERVEEYGLALAALYGVRLSYAVSVGAITTRRIRLGELPLLPLVDAVFLITYLRAPFVRTIRWRDTTLRVGARGKVTPV